MSVLQAARDSYKDLTAPTGGMNWNLVRRFIEVSHTHTLSETTLCRLRWINALIRGSFELD